MAMAASVHGAQSQAVPSQRRTTRALASGSGGGAAGDVTSARAT
jgi:hypothetical protein